MRTATQSTSATDPTSSSTPAPSTAAQPLVRGNLLIDARSGKEFVPRGVNWSTFEYACAQGRGYSALDAMSAPDPATAVAKAIHAWGANTVRLPLNQDCWLGTRGAPVSDANTTRTPDGYRAEIEGFVSALNAEGIVVILDLQSRKRADSDEFGNLAMPDAQSLEFWTSLAAVYAANPSVMFDGFNEPSARRDTANKLIFTLTWNCWRDGGCKPPAQDAPPAAGKAYPTYTAVGMTQVVATIRKAGAKQPILLGGLDYANDLSQWQQYAPRDDQLVAAFHNYDFNACSKKSCWDSLVAPLARHVPVLTSELGANNPTDGYVSSYLTWADAHGIGVLFWFWVDDPKASMALTKDELGTPTAYGVLARTWLLSH